MGQCTWDRVPITPRKAWLLRLFLLLVGLGLACGAGEFLVRVLAPQKLSGRWTEGTESGLLVNRANWTARHEYRDLTVTYRFNEHHLRGGPIGSGARVLVLGDSFTFGWLLNEEDTYLHLLGERADRELGPGRLQLLNGARGGWGTGDYLAFLEENGDAIAPAMVVVFLNFDDINRSVSGKHYRLTDADNLIAERTRHRLSLKRRLTDHLLVYDWLLAHSHLTQLVRSSVERAERGWRLWTRRSVAEARPISRDRLPCAIACTPAPGASDPPPADPCNAPDVIEGMVLGRALFHRLNQWCRQRGIPLLVLTTGCQVRYLKPPIEGSAIDLAFLRSAPEFFQREGIPFHDLRTALTEGVKGNWNDYLIDGDGHPNVAGARLIAACAWPWLSSHWQRWLEERRGGTPITGLNKASPGGMFSLGCASFCLDEPTERPGTTSSSKPP